MDLNLLQILGRERLRIPEASKFDDKRVAITGAGGSIGSAIAKRLYGEVEYLLLVDIVEAPLFRLRQELEHMGKRPTVVEYLVEDAGREPGSWMYPCNPDRVIHAGAHKHVGLMEKEPQEAFRNNTLSTMRIAAAARARMIQFTFISTDKAVKPTCNMGASKCLAEAWLISHMCKASICRFGNVAGSSGSLIEIVHDRLLRGHAVTLNARNMMRWFITPDEAVDLVLAASFESGIYTLDMGKQVYVEDIIRRTAKAMDRPLELIIGSPLPGEKIMEDIVTPEEEIVRTPDSDLLRVRTMPRVDKVDLAIEAVRHGASLVEAANAL